MGEESQEGLVNTAESPEGMGYTEGSQEGMEDTEEESQEDFADTEEESQEEVVNDNHIIIDQNGASEVSPSSEHITIDDRYEESKENYLGKSDSVDVYENKHVQDEEEMGNYPDLEAVGKGFTRVHNNESGNSNERVI